MATLLGHLSGPKKTKIIALASTEVGSLVDKLGLQNYQDKLIHDNKTRNAFYVYHSNGLLPSANKHGDKLNYKLYLLIMTGMKGRSLLKQSGHFGERVFHKEASCFISMRPSLPTSLERRFDVVVTSNTGGLKRLDLFFELLPVLINRGLLVRWLMLGEESDFTRSVMTKFQEEIATGRLTLSLNSYSNPCRESSLYALAQSKALLHLNQREGGPRTFGEALLCATSIFLPRGFLGGGVTDIPYDGYHHYDEESLVDLLCDHTKEWGENFVRNCLSSMAHESAVCDRESRTALSGVIEFVTQGQFFPSDTFNLLDVRLPNHGVHFLKHHASATPAYLSGHRFLTDEEFLKI